LLAVIVSTIAYYAAHIVPTLLPELAMRIIPGRLLNVQTFVSTPLALAMAICWVDRSQYWKPGSTVWIARTTPVAIVALIIVSATIYAVPRRTAIAEYARTVLETRIMGRPSLAQQQDELFWRDVRRAHISGLVLASSTAAWPSLDYGHLAVALYGFDYIPYLPQTAGAVAQTVQEGYGVSFSDPPPELYHRANLQADTDTGRSYWAQLSDNDWCHVSRDLGIAALVAPNDWIVNLRVLVPGPEFTVYAVSCE
jgi:hypothetical protein